jgi:hypothetical protein
MVKPLATWASDLMGFQLLHSREDVDTNWHLRSKTIHYLFVTQVHRTWRLCLRAHMLPMNSKILKKSKKKTKKCFFLEQTSLNMCEFFYEETIFQNACFNSILEHHFFREHFGTSFIHETSHACRTFVNVCFYYFFAKFTVHWGRKWAREKGTVKIHELSFLFLIKHMEHVNYPLSFFPHGYSWTYLNREFIFAGVNLENSNKETILIRVECACARHMGECMCVFVGNSGCAMLKNKTIHFEQYTYKPDNYHGFSSTAFESGSSCQKILKIEYDTLFYSNTVPFIL